MTETPKKPDGRDAGIGNTTVLDQQPEPPSRRDCLLEE